jgi:predicted nucleic acid-binding protein
VILVDTSVWINHLRKTSTDLSDLLENNRVVMHPLVLGELACGNLKNRTQLLKLWHGMNSIPTVNHEETLFFIEHNQLMGKGIGYIDAQLLASIILVDGAKLWTLDKRLAAVADRLGIAWAK